MDGYPPGFSPNGEGGQQSGRLLPEFAFKTLPFPPPPGFPYPRPFISNAPLQDQVMPVPFNAAAPPFHNGPPMWLNSEPQGLLPFPGPPGARPFRGRDNNQGPWLQRVLQQPGGGFGGAAGSPRFSGSVSRPAWVEDILAQDSVVPSKNHTSQSPGQVGGSMPGGGQRVVESARKRSKEEGGPGGPAKRARNGEREGRDLQENTRIAERGEGKAAFAQGITSSSTAKAGKAVRLRSSEVDAQEGRRLQPRGGRGASVKQGASEELRKRNAEERTDSRGGAWASQRGAERDEGRKAGELLKDSPGKPENQRKPEGSLTGAPEFRGVSSPPGFQDPRVFQLSTPLQRHRDSPTPPKTSPLADAIKQKVQLWQSAKAGTASGGGVNDSHGKDVQTSRREGFNTARGAPVDIRREGGVRTDQRGGPNSNQGGGQVSATLVNRLPSPLVGHPRDWQKLSAGRGGGGRLSHPVGGDQGTVLTSHAQLAQRLAEIKERFSATPPLKLAAPSVHWKPLERPPSAEAPWDPVKDFVAEIKERVSSPTGKVTTEHASGRKNPESKPPERGQANERLARIKERLSITPPPPERSPSGGPEPETPAANSRLAQIKERLSFPAAKNKPRENTPSTSFPRPSPAPILIAPPPSVFPPPQNPRPRSSQTAAPSISVKAPVSVQKATEVAGAGTSEDSGGENRGPETGVNRDTTPAGSGAGAGQPDGVNKHQEGKQLKDRQVWKIPERLQKLLDQGLVKDPPPAAHPPSAQAVQALNLMHGASKLSKKQLQRLKGQAHESKELAKLQGIVGMHNVPLIMQTYWEVKGRPNAADGAASNSSEPLFPIHEQIKILRQVARKSRKKLGKLRKKEALQQRQQTSGGVEKPGTGPTVACGGTAKLEGEPGGPGGAPGKLAANPSSDVENGASAVGADLKGASISEGGGSVRSLGSEAVGTGGTGSGPKESRVERTAAGLEISQRSVLGEAAVVTAGSNARKGLIGSGPKVGQGASEGLRGSEDGDVSGAPVTRRADSGLGREKTLSGDTEMLGGVGHALASGQSRGQVTAQGKTSGVSEARQKPSDVSSNAERRADPCASIMVAPVGSTVGRQVAAEAGERKADEGVSRLNGQSGVINTVGKGVSQPTSEGESRGDDVGQQKAALKAGEDLKGKLVETVTGKRKAAGGSESVAFKKHAGGSGGKAGASKGLLEKASELDGFKARENLTSAVAHTEPVQLETGGGTSVQPGGSSVQPKAVLSAEQGLAKSAGLPGVGLAGTPALSGSNELPQSSSGKSGYPSDPTKAGAQAPAQRSEHPLAEPVQTKPLSAKLQSAPSAAEPAPGWRSLPAGAVLGTRPLTSAPPGVVKPPAVDEGLLAELRAKALASQCKKASEAVVKPSETTVKPSITTVTLSETTVRVSERTIRLSEGVFGASETVVGALGTRVMASETVESQTAVVVRASDAVRQPSATAEKASETAGARSVEAGKASDIAAPVGPSKRAAGASAAHKNAGPKPSAQTKAGGTTLKQSTGVSIQTEAGSRQPAGQARGLLTLGAGQPAAATASPPKLTPSVGVPQSAPGQNAVQAKPPLVSRPVFPGLLNPGLQFGSAVKPLDATNPPEGKPSQSQPLMLLNSTSPPKSTGLPAQQGSAFGISAPFISGALGTNLAFGSGTTTKPGQNAPHPGLRQSLPSPDPPKGGQEKQLPSGFSTAGPLGKSSPEDALAATIKALRDSIQRQAEVASSSMVGDSGSKSAKQELPRGKEEAPPGGGASEQTRRLAYIKKRKNVLVRRVTPQRGALAQASRPVSESGVGADTGGNKGAGAVLSNRGVAPSGKSTPGESKRQVGGGLGKQRGGLRAGALKRPVGNAVHQRKALSWQRASAASGATSAASPHTPLLQGPRRKQGARGLTWKLGGPVTPGGAPKLRQSSLKSPRQGPRGSGKFSAKKSGLGPGKPVGRQSAVKRRAALKWSRQKGTARTPGWATPLPWSDEKGSLLNMLRQLRGQRSYTSTYAKSTNGLSLKRTGAVGLKGNLKWTLSGGKKRKEAAEKAAQAVRGSLDNDNGDPAGTSARKRKAAAAARATARSRRASLEASLRRRPGAAPPNRERVITVGLATYKMDAGGRTLVRVSEPTTPGAFTPPATTPRRASVNGQTFVRQGTSDRLVIDPTSARKTLASGRLKWSLQNARRRRATKGETLCPYFTKYGKCNREGATCPFVHDKDKVAICTKFVLGRCENSDCTLTHKIIPERMPVCKYFLEGTCTNERCPFRHVSVVPNAPVCREFLQGFCPRGDTCPQKHTSVCPKFAADGQCEEGEKCGFYHPTKRTWTLARALKEAGRKRKRLRPAKPETPPDLGEGGILLPPDDGVESEAPERPRVRRRYFEADVSEVARKIKPAFLFDDV
ncbi:hypothetical protein KFL_002650040 [Klebsormidium nitens]|uniref:C3H1-type domain-containing protein n=1 Tax=Klebsormidium nitens TaxID=105231 RepID=A0A1Y1ID47_KLENI|nr:hypothetical protein KFL_002650040 [Klebsormidium nitens]|eukprot:GAQ86008.1 hypothetical protein KFL_002650040 [Klebsormidium nitens]